MTKASVMAAGSTSTPLKTFDSSPKNGAPSSLSAEERSAITALFSVQGVPLYVVARRAGLGREEAARVIAQELEAERTRSYDRGVRDGRLSLRPHNLKLAA